MHGKGYRLYVRVLPKYDAALTEINAGVDEDQGQRWSKSTDHNTIDHSTTINTASPKGDALRSRSVQDYFVEAYTRKFGRKPAINFGKDLATVKKTLPLFNSLDEIKSLIDAFLASEYAARVGYSLSICFAAHTINLWQAGQLTAPLKTSFSTTKV